MIGLAKKWIQKANIKKGALHKQLGIPQDKKVPSTLLNKISAAKTGTTIKNPTKTGRKSIKVTTQLKRRAALAKTLKKTKK